MKIETSLQIEFAKFRKRPVFRYNSSTMGTIEENSDKLVQAYTRMRDKFEREYSEEISRYNSYLKAWNLKRCEYCGFNLRYLEAFNFWGCSNYKSPGQHTKFHGEEPTIYPARVGIKTTWLNDFIDETGLKGKVRVSDLYEFILENGFEDLRLKYGKNSSDTNFTSFQKAKKRSLEQEREALKLLKTIFDRVVYQQCIEYKYLGQKQNFCIPDFICSKGNNVFVVDAKLDFVDDKKMTMYVELVKFILNAANDKRDVSGAFIMYKTDKESVYDKGQFKIFEL